MGGGAESNKLAWVGLETVILLISVTQVARITGMNHMAKSSNILTSKNFSQISMPDTADTEKILTPG
jgi:hypothetical protein